MKTKAKIVEKLLEEKHITAEEAVILLQETPTFQQFTPSTIIDNGGKVPYHTICGCDVCNCIMGNKLVDPNNTNSGNWTTDYTYTTSNTNNKTQE